MNSNKNIIGLYWPDGDIQDSDGNWFTESQYINKMTPMKNNVAAKQCMCSKDVCDCSASLFGSPTALFTNSLSKIVTATSTSTTQIFGSNVESPTFSMLKNEPADQALELSTDTPTKKITISNDILVEPKKIGQNEMPKSIGQREKTSNQGVAVGESEAAEIKKQKKLSQTLPSLLVVARPTLNIDEANIDNQPALDNEFNSILMKSATEFIKWLIHKRLVRSKQTCQIHPDESLELCTHSDESKFPYSGGYVWKSDCCPSHFVSFFYGSLFEAAPHPPSVIFTLLNVLLQLIYHWSRQSNVQNVLQSVKVDGSYVQRLFTWLRAICTVTLHQHMTLLGGSGKRIEVGVISFGAANRDGQKFKVEVLGVLDPVTKVVRLHSVEPLADGEKNHEKRYARILEPLALWVNKTSEIATDLTVDTGTLLSMGYKFINRARAPNGKFTNSNIMDYLRTNIARMFQNTLSLLSRATIQQFLDELVWREWYGTTPARTFEHIVSHIAEQTQIEGAETLVNRLSTIAANPFLHGGHFLEYSMISSPPRTPPMTTPSPNMDNAPPSPMEPGQHQMHSNVNESHIQPSNASPNVAATVPSHQIPTNADVPPPNITPNMANAPSSAAEASLPATPLNLETPAAAQVAAPAIDSPSSVANPSSPPLDTTSNTPPSTKRIMLVDPVTGAVNVVHMSADVQTQLVDSGDFKYIPSASVNEQRITSARATIDTESALTDDCQPDDSDDEKTPGQCPVEGCSSVFKHLKNKHRHIRDYHGILSSDGNYYRRRIRCSHCKTLCLNQSNLGTHHKLKHQKLEIKFKEIKQKSENRLIWF